MLRRLAAGASHSIGTHSCHTAAIGERTALANRRADWYLRDSMTRPETTAAPPAAAPPRARGSLGGRLARLALKELRETLRDRRTIGTLLLMPIFVYPLLTIAFQRFLVTHLRPPGGALYIVAVESSEASQLLQYLVSYGHVLIENDEQADAARNEDPETAAREVPPSDDVKFVVADDVEAMVAELEADLGMRLISRGERHPIRGVPLESEWEALVVESSPTSRTAYQFVERRLQATNVELLRQRLLRAGRSATTPVQSVRTTIESHHAGLGFSLATLVPLILILMTMTGAVYPAIDLTAGERERGTLEALIAAPVPRMGLLLAKYAAVLVVALMTAGVNLAAMTGTVLATGLSPLLFGEAGLSWGVVISVIGLLVLLAAFFSAVLLALTSFARSFKEAQAYLIPLMLVSMAPGMLSLVPGLELNGALAVTPLVNIVLLARDLLDRSVDPALAAVVVASTAVYALAAIAAAARIFGTDAILYGSEGTWSDAFRRPSTPTPVPSLGTALICLALLFPSSMLTAAALAQQEELPLSVRLVTSSLATAALFGLLPLAIAAWRRIDVLSGFGLRSARALAWIGAIVLGLSLWPLVYELTLLASQLVRLAGAELFDPQLLRRVGRLAEQFRTLPPAVVILSLAVIPAVFEELFFRGFLFGALRGRFRPAATIVLSAVLFGVFHVVVRDMLAVERLLPSTALGLALGWLRSRSGSVLPGMLLHACHNASLLLLVYYQKSLEQIEWLNLRGWLGSEAGSGHLPTAVLAIAGAGTMIGLACAHFTRRPEA